jgi:thiamine pyrophosphokinase
MTKWLELEIDRIVQACAKGDSVDRLRAEITALVEDQRQLAEREFCAKTEHCFRDTGQVLTSNPPQYPQVCIHCGGMRIRVTQDPNLYSEIRYPNKLRLTP